MSPAVTSIAIAVVERDGQFLVGPRPADKPLAGFWEFPGGRIEAGELPEQAAVRECLEETGLTIAVTGSFPGKTQDYSHGRLQLHFFACRPDPAGQVARAPFRWVSRHELKSLRFPEGNRELLQFLLGDGERPVQSDD